MKKITKVAVLFIVVTILFTITACDTNDTNDTSDTNVTNEPQTRPAQEADPASEPDTIIDNTYDIIHIQPGQGSPEEAVVAFFTAFRSSDLSGMIDTFITNPDEDELLFSLAIETQRGAVAASIMEHFFMLSFLSSGIEPEEMFFDVIGADGTASWFHTQLEDMIVAPNPSSLELLGFLQLEDLPRLAEPLGLSDFFENILDNEAMEVRHNNMAQNFGADSFMVTLAVFEIDGNPYLQIFELLEYNGHWQIAHLGGNFGRVIANNLSLDIELNGLLPLYHISMYTSVDERTVRDLREDVFDAMLRISGLDTDSHLTSDGVGMYEGIGFSSPEEAVTAYLEGLRDGSFEQMFASFPIETVVMNTNLEATVEQFGFYDFWMGLPNVNDFVFSMNMAAHEYVISTALLQKYILLSVFESGQDAFELMEVIQDAISARDFQIVYDFIIPNLNTLNVLGFIHPERLNDFSEVLGGMELREEFFSEGMQNLFLMSAENIGADSMSSLIVVFEINDNIYLLCIDVVEYSGKWYINDFGGFLSSTLGLHHGWQGLIPVTYIGEEYGFDPDGLREMMQNIQ